LSAKAPKHPLAEVRDDFRRIVYAANAATVRTAFAAFERTWNKRCPGVVTSLREGGDELLTFFRFPKRSGKRYEPRTRLSGSTRSSDDA